LALVEPGGRPLDQWVLAFILFWLLPRRGVWCLAMAGSLEAPDRGGWAELALDPGWHLQVAEGVKSELEQAL
jgi:hypothetical protein